VARLLPAETRLSGSDYVPTPCPPVPSHGRSGADDVPVGTPVGNCRRCRPFGPSPCLASYPERISSCLLSPSNPTRKPNHVGAGNGRTWRQPLTGEAPAGTVKSTARVGSPLPPAGAAARGGGSAHGMAGGGGRGAPPSASAADAPARRCATGRQAGGLMPRSLWGSPPTTMSGQPGCRSATSTSRGTTLVRHRGAPLVKCRNCGVAAVGHEGLVVIGHRRTA